MGKGGGGKGASDGGWTDVQRKGRRGAKGGGAGKGGEDRPWVQCPKRCGPSGWLYTDRLEECSFKCKCGAAYARSLATVPQRKPAAAQPSSPESGSSGKGGKSLELKSKDKAAEAEALRDLLLQAVPIAGQEPLKAL